MGDTIGWQMISLPIHYPAGYTVDQAAHGRPNDPMTVANLNRSKRQTVTPTSSRSLSLGGVATNHLSSFFRILIVHLLGLINRVSYAIYSPLRR
jgi:hypothetical protein